MGCDEPAGVQVAKALLRLTGVDNFVKALEGKSSSSGQHVAGHSDRKNRGRRGSAKAKPAARDELRTAARNAADNRVPQDRPQTNKALEQALDARIEKWRRAGNTVAAGNLGEQIALLVLEKARYTVTATQAELDAAIPAIIGDPTTKMHSEDFTAFDEDGRYMTVNAKARMTEGGTLKDGNLAAPRISAKQRAVAYSRIRAGLPTPIDGDPFGQVVAIDLLSKTAQIFEIEEDGSLTRIGEPVSVLQDALEIAARFPTPMCFLLDMKMPRDNDETVR